VAVPPPQNRHRNHPEEKEEMGAPTNKDWGQIHAKAWRDREFRTLLEQDPKKALAQYGKEVGKTFDQVVKIAPKPKGVAAEDLARHENATAPPACC
jgi:hypothetical protein